MNKMSVINAFKLYVHIDTHRPPLKLLILYHRRVLHFVIASAAAKPDLD